MNKPKSLVWVQPEHIFKAEVSFIPSKGLHPERVTLTPVKFFPCSTVSHRPGDLFTSTTLLGAGLSTE